LVIDVDCALKVEELGMTQDNLWKVFLSAMPEWDELRRSGVAYEAGNYGAALRLGEGAIETATNLGRLDVVQHALQLLAMCNAKLAHVPDASVAPQGCAFCCKVEGIPAHRRDEHAYICDDCVTRGRARIRALVATDVLAAQRTPSFDGGRRCSFCAVGAGAIAIVFGSGDTGALCADCLEDFSEVIPANHWRPGTGQ
jgi:hypothetical protein